ncbi:hypothetical protein KIN20_028757 [Parelaphostrongylus tenuis]|uniref:Methyltransferase FkbM domain-containing protein n=1 Tax=Parelaphostrongylus tenuis TaxID=148309 RepID=A0AAD5R219_PARTN|nr:hypothetical protein KIN20_028757 [Parelaphostrongylus tenuis]
MKPFGVRFVLLVAVILLLVYIIRIKHTTSENEVPARKSAIAAAFMDWRQCAMSQMDKIGSEPEKVAKPSVIISLGIGADVTAEEKLKQVVPSVLGQYGPITIEHIDILTFIKKMVRRNFIDYIIIDNEGPEYDIIPMIAVEELFAKNDIVFCQINVEFHVQGSEEHKAKFSKIMFDLLQVGRYAVIRHQKYRYQLMYLVDFKDPQCVEKYLKQFLTDD